MDPLDSILAEAEAEVAALKARKHKHPLPSTLAAEARENLYLPFRLVAMFHKTHCVHCGATVHEFEGIFEERKHVRVSDLHLVRQPFVPLNIGTLPRVKKYLPRDVPYCAACVNLDSYIEE